MNSGNGRSRRSGASIEHVSDFFSMIVSHRYSPFDPVSWLIAFILMGMVSAVVVGHSALNGKSCAPGFNPWNPNSYVRRAGCWVHWLLKDVPDDFNRDPGLEKGTADQNVVAPPTADQNQATVVPSVPGTSQRQVRRFAPQTYYRQQ